jgi:hypothetical protein
VRWHVAEAKEPTWAWAQPGGAAMGIVIEASENGEEKPLESSFHCLPVEKKEVYPRQDDSLESMSV